VVVAYGDITYEFSFSLPAICFRQRLLLTENMSIIIAVVVVRPRVSQAACRYQQTDSIEIPFRW